MAWGDVGRLLLGAAFYTGLSSRVELSPDRERCCAWQLAIHECFQFSVMWGSAESSLDRLRSAQAVTMCSLCPFWGRRRHNAA